MRDIEDVMRDLVHILNELGTEYVIVGGMAVNCWGNIRTTRDIDVIIDLKDVEEFVKEMEKKGFIVKIEDIKKAIKEESHFTIFDREYVFHIDVKGVYGKRERESMERKREIEIDNLKIYVASPEDVIANKLLFGSEQDVKDAESVYVRQKEKINTDYLKKRCRDLGVYKEYKEMVKRIKKYMK
ncbi:MAG TPA: hypothetical protein ENI33_08550 [Thermoplasmatales archaeon]|nr:hypothetical protein [Thermoplasmatales archaeon]